MPTSNAFVTLSKQNKRESESQPSLFTSSHDTHIFLDHSLAHLSPTDRLLFRRFGQGAVTVLPYTCIHHAFEAYAAANPNAIAAYHLEESITYGELDRQANRLATLLAQQGVKAGDHVHLFVKRSIPMLVGILASLKVGAAYIPQDVGVTPAEQLRYIINIASTQTILTLSEFRHLVPAQENNICISIDDEMAKPFDGNTEYIAPFVPNVEITRHHPCIILFTSGTTGQPNGVQVTHGNLCNILLTEPGNLNIVPGMKVSQILNIAFDMAAWEILGCLSNGATLVIRGKDFESAVEDADVIISTPTVLSSFDIEKCQNAKVVAVAGEPCPRPLADKWAEFCTFYNSCGPTETTIVNTMQVHHPAREQLTIGKPTPNNTVYILDEKMKACAIGHIGEMWAGGDCVTAGYLKNDKLTAGRYLPDPFLGDSRMMFRTRDLGRWTSDGLLEHLGRTDEQVKIRGFRVELDSVSNALETVSLCKRAVTLKLDDRHLVAFVSPCIVDEETAKQAVATKLPYYCVPLFIIALEELPQTDRGKIDKRMLMDLARARYASEFGEIDKSKEDQGV